MCSSHRKPLGLCLVKCKSGCLWWWNSDLCENCCAQCWAIWDTTEKGLLLSVFWFWFSFTVLSHVACLCTFSVWPPGGATAVCKQNWNLQEIVFWLWLNFSKNRNNINTQHLQGFTCVFDINYPEERDQTVAMVAFGISCYYFCLGNIINQVWVLRVIQVQLGPLLLNDTLSSAAKYKFQMLQRNPKNACDLQHTVAFISVENI